MKKITLNIEESKFKTFLSFIQTLGYVSVVEEEPVADSQQKEVQRRLELLEKGEMTSRSWEEAEKEVFKK